MATIGEPWYKQRRTKWDKVKCFFGRHKRAQVGMVHEDVVARCTCGRIQYGGYWFK